MQPSEVYRLLGRRARRGLIIFPSLWFASLATVAVASLIPGGHSWAVAAIFASILSYVAFGHVRKGLFLAWTVSENPQLVYWAQPNIVVEKVSPDLIDFKFLTLHLRNGQRLEVHLPAPEMSRFIVWLSKRNPSIRWGPYDKHEDPAC